MKTERTSEGKFEQRAAPSVATKRTAEAAAKMIRDAKTGRMAQALSSANRKVGLFKK